MKKLMVSIISAIAFGCVPKEGPNCHTGITINNQSDKCIYCSWSIQYPDSIAGAGIVEDPDLRFLGGSTGKMYNYSVGHLACMEFRYSSFYKSASSVDTLMVYVYDEDVVRNNTWQDIRDNYLVRQRYDLSLGDMRALDWTLSYPPDERMKGIKMWPPYGSK